MTLLTILGTGETSKKLVEAVRHSLHSTGGQTKAHFLLDYCRGNRNVEGQSSCTMLQPLLQDYAVIYTTIALFKHFSDRVSPSDLPTSLKQFTPF